MNSSAFRLSLLLSLLWCLPATLLAAPSTSDTTSLQTTGNSGPSLTTTPTSTTKAGAAKASSAKTTTKPKKSFFRFGYNGDINLRLELGTRVFNTALIDSTFVSETIGKNSFELLFQPEYGYYVAGNTVLIVSLPMRFEIDFIAGVFYSMQLGVGLRRFLASIVFLEMKVAIDIVAQNQFAFRFAGLNPAVGLAIPVWGQFQLYALARFPVRFYPFIGVGIETNLGLQILF